MLTAWFAAVNGWRLTVLVLGAAAVHELGHWSVLKALGARVLGLRISALGAVLAVDSRGLSYGKELAVTLAGPAANLLSAVVLAGAGMETAAGVHIVLSAFNLLPIRPLDGGRALHLAASWLLGPAAGEAAARWIGAVTAAGLAAGLYWVMVKSGGSLWLLPAAVGALCAAGRECFGK
ncbi:MAG: peptidase M50 [Oscillospiraceae bacterium]|nr:peptidase M50 [Oscillospiraceae bacterium]